MYRWRTVSTCRSIPADTKDFRCTNSLCLLIRSLFIHVHTQVSIGVRFYYWQSRISEFLLSKSNGKLFSDRNVNASVEFRVFAIKKKNAIHKNGIGNLIELFVFPFFEFHIFLLRDFIKRKIIAAFTWKMCRKTISLSVIRGCGCCGFCWCVRCAWWSKLFSALA